MKINVKNGLLILAMIIAVGISIVSCKKGFLDVTDPNVYSADNYPATIEDLNIELNDLYGRLRSGIYSPELFRFFGVSRDHTADQAYQAPDFNAATQLSYDKTNGDVGSLWDSHYENIAKCVNTLGDIARFRTKNPNLTTVEKEELNFIEGQARFVRAWNYMMLVNFYGETMITSDADKAKMGVPIITKLAAVVPETQVPRSSIGEVWTYITDDLKAAEALLGTKTWTGSDVARASGWTVKAMLGKAYVYSQQWALASAKLKEVIEGSGKSLVSFDIFKEMFNGRFEFNNESLFELNFVADRNEEWNGSANVGQRLSIYLSPAYEDNNSVGKNGFGNYFIHEKNLSRFGFTGTAITRNELRAPAYLAQSKTNRDNKVVDPRLWVVAFQPYLDSIAWDNKSYATAKMPGDGVSTDNIQAWCWHKYVMKDKFIWAGNVANANNMYILRLADVYLLYAEASMKTGATAIALEYINKVHRRAYNVNPNTPSVFDYTSLTAATKAPDAALKNDPLKYERWAELFGEGAWWFDVSRWRLGQNEAAYYEKVTTGNLTWDDKKYALPIPLREINTNTAMKQNNGY
ncbi:MAG: RagB/SusD family nutrient uptake outer membrane protein [Ferruginibacter sp.]|nr:RagB/SusD family nutrient uptake outer membrane protein [Ferruginibacter sp.]